MKSSRGQFAGWNHRVLPGLLCCVGLAMAVASFGTAVASDSSEKASPKKKAGQPDSSQPTTQQASPDPKLLEAKRRAMASIKKTPQPTQATTQPVTVKPMPNQVSPRPTKVRPPISAAGRRRELGRPGEGPAVRPAVPPRETVPQQPATQAPTPTTMKSEDGQDAAEAADYSAATQSPVANTKTTIVLSTEPPDPDARTYRFQYDKAPWADVLSDFSRISGLPVVNLSDPLPGELTYRTSEEMTFTEAIHQLNWLLQQQPLNNYVIQRKAGYLSVGRLPDLMRKIPPEKMFKTFEEFEAADLDPYDVCLTFFEVPEGWTPFEVIEQYRPKFSDTYGTQISGETTIELTGLACEHRLFKEIITKLAAGEKPDRDSDQPKMVIPLKAAKVADVQTILRQWYPVSGPAARPGRRGPQPGIDPNADQAKNLSIVADIKNNVLYLRGPQYLLDEARETIRNIDVDEWREPVQELIHLKNASAASIVQTLKPIFQKQSVMLLKSTVWIPQAMQDALTCDISPVASSNAVILIGGAEGVARARRLVESYDVEPDWITKTIELSHADAADMAATILANLPAANRTLTQPQITPRSSTTLLVSCSEQDYGMIMELVAKLDTVDAEKPREHFVHLDYANPSEVARTLQQVMQGSASLQIRQPPQQVRRVPGQKGLPQPQLQIRGPVTTVGRNPVFIPDDAAGTLIVFCSDKDWPEAERLIQELDTLAGKARPELRTVELEHADATDVAAMLNQMHPPQPGVGQVQQMVTADVYNNTITIFAKADFIEEVLPLIERLDINQSAPMKVIQLHYCKAEVIAPILSQVFPDTAAVTRPQAPIAQPRKGARPQPQQFVRRAAPTGETQVRIVAEPVTNTLVVTAPPEELKLIEDQVAEMEAAAKEVTSIRVIVVAENRPASEIAETLNSLIESPAAGGAKGRPQQKSTDNPAAEPLTITTLGERIILDGPQDKVAEAIQLVNQIDIEDQQPIFRKVKVLDAERDEQKLRTLLAEQQARKAVAPMPRGGGNKPGQVQQVPTATSSEIQIYADTDENTLLIRAMPKDFIAIDEALAVILSDPDVPDIIKDRPDEEPFFLAKLRWRTAWDLSYTLDDLVNVDAPEGHKVQFLEGPTEKSLLVKGFRPAQKELIEKYIAMYDVPESGVQRGGMRFVDVSGKMSPEQVLELLGKGYQSAEGRKINILDSGTSGGRVKIIDIHEGEPPIGEEEKPAAGRESRVWTPRRLRTSQTTPGVQLAAATHAHGPVEATVVCPICHQSPCVLPLKLMASLDEISWASVDSEGAAEPGSGKQSPAEHNHVLEPRAITRADPADEEEDEVTIMVDPDTGKLILVGPEEETRAIQEWIDEVTSGDAPTVIRVFPLRYADVKEAAQLLNQVFNQQQAVVAAAQPRQPQQGAPKGEQPNAKGVPGVVAPQQAGRQQARAPARAAPARIKVVPDERMRSLYVVAPLPDIPLIVEVLKTIDARKIDKDQNIRFFQLVNLDAEQVVESLREILGIQSSPPAVRGRPGQANQGQNPQQRAEQMLQLQGQQGGTLVTAENIKLTAETQTNTIIAKAPPDTLELIGSLIEDLEKQTNNTQVEMRRVVLQHSRATEIADIVEDLAKATAQSTPAGRGGPRGGAASRTSGEVTVNADPRTNSLIIAGPAKDLDRVENLVRDLDGEPGEGTNIEQFAVRGDAKLLAETLKSLFAADPKKSDIIIAANDETNTIVVKSPMVQMAQIAEQIADLDAKVAKDKTYRTIKLVVADAESVAEKLTEVFGKVEPGGGKSAKNKVTIEGIKSTRTLYVQCPDELFKQIETVARDMDRAPDDVQVKRFVLRHAQAEDVHKKLQDMMAQAIGSGSMGELKMDLIGIAPDPRTNALVVTGGPNTMMIMTRVLAEVDVPAEDRFKREQRIIEVGSVNPTEVASAMQQIFDAQKQGQTGRTVPTIKAIPGTTKLVVDATAEEFEQIESLVKKVDIEGGKIVHTVTIPEEVPAQSVAENINKLYGTPGAKDGIKAEAHVPTNTVLVYASETEFEKINEQLIQKISEVSPVGTLKFYKIPLKYAVADEVARTLQDFFDKKAGLKSNQDRFGFFGGGRATSAEKREDQVTVMAEPNSNMLLVYATESTKALIDELLKDIDVDLAGDRVVEMVTLQHMDAAVMLDILTEVLKVSKRSVSESDKPFVPWWMRGDEDEKEDDAVLAGDTRLKAIESTNSIIVAGRREAVADALAKIKELDVPGDGTGDGPRMFVLDHGNAGEIADVLNKTFVESQTASRGGRGGSTSQKRKLTIVPVDSTNTILVHGGKASEVNGVLAMAEALDKQVEDEQGGVRVLPVPSGQNVETLARLFEQQINDAENNMRQRRSDYRPDLVTISADRRSSALLVSGSKAKFEEVEQLLAKIMAMGPAGGRTRTLIKFKTLSPSQVKQLIEQLQEGQDSGSGARNSRGNRGSSDRGRTGGRRSGRGQRGDATWGKDHRYEKLRRSHVPGRATVAGSMPVLMMNLMLGTAVAQTTTQKTQAPPERPIVNTIRQRRPTTQPAKQPGTMTAEDLIKGTARSGRAQISDETLTQMSQSLSGAPLTVVEAGPDGIIIEGLQSDLDILFPILEMLDTAVPEKKIEYVRLNNAQAKDLAKTLTDVFQKVEQTGDRTVLPQDKVDVIADFRTNGLYIAATEEKMRQALELIAKNDGPQDPQRTFKAFFFKNRRVSEAGEVLKKLAASFLKQKGLDASLISIEVDPQNNSVFVTAGEAYLAFIEKMVETLDVEMPAIEEGKGRVGQADIMVVPLRVAAADSLATLLSELLTKAATGDTPMKDFIRRLRLLDENGNPLAEVNLDRPIFVFGEPDSNALIIASTVENCLIMKQVAMAFDKEPAKSPVESQVFTLEYADATEVADKIGALLTSSEALTQRPGKTEKGGVPIGDAGALVYAAAISADARTNQVVLVGRPEAVDVLGGLIKSLDVKGRGVMPFDIVKLEFASATGLATALTEMMDKRKDALPTGGENSQKSETVIITPDPRSQTLIIAARRERMEELKELIRKLDVRASALIENIRTITLKHGNATDLAQKLQDLWTQTQQQRGGEAGGFQLEVPAIVADERSNSLIVSASKSDFEAIKSVVDKIEALELNPMANIFIVRLMHNSATQLSSALQTLFDRRAEMRNVDGNARPEDKVTIEVDEVTNSLLVAASRENYEVLMQKIKELDVEIGVMGRVEFFVCENVSAARVKDTVEALFENGPFKPGVSGESAATQDREKVTVVVDERSNVLIASASPENMELVRDIHQRMNSVTTPWDVAITTMIDLKYADCVQVAAQLEDFFQGVDQAVAAGSDSNRQALFAVKIFTQESNNRVIVGGTKDGIDRAVELIKKLDVPPGEATQAVEVYRLHEAPAARIGEVLTNIFQERNQPRTGQTGASVPGIAVTLEVDESSNALVVNASRFDHVLIKELVTLLDRPSTMLSMVKIFSLGKATSTKVKEILDEIYQSAGDSQGGRNAVSVVEDGRTNSVVVSAPPGELANIEELIHRLDEVKIEGAAEVGVFACENEDANKMSELLNEIMSGQPAQGGGGGGARDDQARDMRSMLVTMRAENGSGEAKLLQTIRENVQISFNERTNSVIVVAPPSSLRLIEELVRKLDRIQKRPVLVKVFLLQHADATRMIELLESMFAQDQGSQQQQEFQEGREVTVEGGMSETGGVPSAQSQDGPTQKGTFGRPRTTFVADERTNAVIAAGWPEDIDVVADLIDQLDSRDIQARDSFVYSLVNMEAPEMQTALDTYFQGEAQRLDQIDAMSPQQRMERDVSVVAHEESNQLIVSASPRIKSEVVSIIEQLDRPPPQVMIQVMIAEVTLDDRFEMGLEFALQQLRFSETAVQGPNGVLQSGSFDVIGGTDLGAAGSGLGGFSFTITGEDFNFLVRALQVDSRLEVIQRPMIVVQDNQEGRIIVGQNVPFLRGTQVTDNGQVNSQVEFEDIGIELTVTPNINPDGFVYMTVHPSISALTSSTLDIGNGVLAPIFTNREAETVVVAKDGETIVIGGLITTTDNESESKVPILGDIPGLGVLFRTTTRTKQKTELLIAMTPRIMRTVEDARRISLEERDRSGIITPRMKQSPLFEKLQVMPESDSEIESIEDVPVEPLPGAEQNPAAPTKTEPKPPYGPKVPRYGPLVPSGEDVVARRSSRALDQASATNR
jgi:type II secretion system protein D